MAAELRQSQFYYCLAGLWVVLLIVVAIAALRSRAAEYPAIAALHHVPGGDAERGRGVLEVKGCGSCHVIPGVAAAQGRVGPSLADFPRQSYIAGRLPNTAEHLVAWIQNPQAIDPRNAMPKLPMTEQEARDMAAYLYRLR